jgi:hypothetical protein
MAKESPSVGQSTTIETDAVHELIRLVAHQVVCHLRQSSQIKDDRVRLPHASSDAHTTERSTHPE